MDKTWKYIAVLLGVLLFHLAANYQVLTKSQIAHAYDESPRIREGFVKFEQLFGVIQRSESKFSLITRLDEGQAHPPFFELMEAFTWKILSVIKRMDVELMILAVNSFFLAILLFSIFGIGAILYNRNVGLLAALLVSFFPSTFGFSRNARLDFPLSCMAALSFFLLLKTNGFSSKIYSVLFGITAGLSFLTKETAILFMIVPVSYYFMKAYLTGNKRQVISNMLVALLCFCFVAGMVYFRPCNFQAYGLYMKKMAIDSGQSSRVYYLKILSDLVGPWILILSVPWLVNYFIHLKKRDWFLFFWCFVPILLFSFSSNKTMRFMLPVTPAFALILAREVLVNHWPQGVRRACVFALAVLSIAQYGFYHTGYLKGTVDSGDFLSRGILSITRHDADVRAAAKLFDVFKNEATNSKTEKNIIFLFNREEIAGPLEIKLVMAQLPFMVISPLARDAAGYDSVYSTAHLKKMLNADYVLDLVGGAQRNGCQVTKQLENDLIKNFSEHKDSFVKIAESPAYDSSLIYVYKRIRR